MACNYCCYVGGLHLNSRSTYCGRLVGGSCLFSLNSQQSIRALSLLLATLIAINVLTLGIFSLFINAFMLELSSFISRNLLHAGVAN